MLAGVLGTAPKINLAARGSQVVLLRVGKVSVQGETKGAGSEAYVLDVDANQGVTITGADADGLFYGIQTLLQLLPPTSFAGSRTSVSIPTVHIKMPQGSPIAASTSTSRTTFTARKVS